MGQVNEGWWLAQASDQLSQIHHRSRSSWEFVLLPAGDVDGSAPARTSGPLVNRRRASLSHFGRLSLLLTLSLHLDLKTFMSSSTT